MVNIFLFYLQGKPKLPGKIVDKIWPYLEGAQYSNFTWYFFKCKSCDKSMFTRKRELESYYDIEAIRNFRCLEDVKVDPLVDMTISYVRICGKDNSVSLFLIYWKYICILRFTINLILLSI